jgi:hypothetical protein
VTLDEILAQGRAIWGLGPTPLPHMAVVLGVVVGDINRQARNQTEGYRVNDTELAKELGNLVLSAVRFMDDIGYIPAHCIELAQAAQAAYAEDLDEAGS